MAERFVGKVVLITGAGGGFGAAAARAFAAEGAAVAMSDLDKAALDKSVSRLPGVVNVYAEPLDVTNESAWAGYVHNATTALGPVDIAVMNAGIGQVLTPLQHTTVCQFDRIMEVNTKGVFLGMRAVLPAMIARGSGAVVNIASAAGLLGAGHIAAYAASKHAVVGLTRSAADEMARHNIRVNALCPSFAPTALFNEIADNMAARQGTDRDGAYARITGRIPMRRLASVDEVVQAILWCADPANSFMTGQAIGIDGGLTAV